MVLNVNTSEVTESGENYNVIFNFKQNDDSLLKDYMPDITLDLSATGSLNPSPITISKNTANSTYTAPDSDSDSISVKYSTTTLTSYSLSITSTPSYEYISTPTVNGESFVDYVKVSGVSVNVSIVCDKLDGFYDHYDDGWTVCAYFDNGSSVDLGVSANNGSFVFDLSVLDDYLVSGSVYNISFRPPKSAFGDYGAPDFDKSLFNNLTINVAGQSGENEIKYASTPTFEGNTFVNYEIGENKIINVSISCDNFDKFESYNKFYATIEGIDGDIFLNGVMANENPALVDLKSISNYLEVGHVYTIYFHPDLSDLSAYLGIKSGEYVFKTLTVNVTGVYTPSEVKILYNSTITPNVLNYTKNTHTLITFTANYNSSKTSAFEYRSMYIYINGEEIMLNNILASNMSFTLDLADFSDKFVDGINNISIHPKIDALRTVFQTTDDVFRFYNITINVTKETSKPTYNITSINSIEYIQGESKNITATIKYDPAYIDANLPIYIYINDKEAILINNVKANDTGFIINLADYNLDVGLNNITFHPDIDDLSNVADGEFNFTKISVLVSKKQITPILTISVNTPFVGENATIIVSVSQNATGNVTITIGDNNPVSVALTNAKAILNVLSLSYGTYNVNVVYNGDENYTQASNSTKLVVSKITLTDNVFDISTLENQLIVQAKLIMMHQVVFLLLVVVLIQLLKT